MPAKSPATFIFIGIDERMAALTMGLSCVDSGDGIASSHVLSCSHRLKMIGVDAARIPTQVIQLETFRYWATQVLISHSMSKDGSVVDTG